MKRVCLGVCLVLLFLSVTAFADETVLIDAENGIWQYASPELSVTVKRFIDESMPLVWYEADIIASQSAPLQAVLNDSDRPGAFLRSPEQIATENKFVFAINDDFFTERIDRGEVVGMVVRNGRIYSRESYGLSGTFFPNLDCMALYPDGSLKVYETKELSAQDYVDNGAFAVFAFGPILIRDGEISEKLNEHFLTKEPRTAIGMVAPYHYAVVVAEGRQERSNGATCLFLAKRLHAMGAKEAINLDGGQTSAILFMGTQLNRTGQFGSMAEVRNVPGLIGIGQWE